MSTCRLCEATLKPDRISCPSCGACNVSDSNVQTIGLDITVALSEVVSADVNRIRTDLCDENFGETIDDNGKVKSTGLVRTSTVLLGGSPGAGKSTLSLQLCDIVSDNDESLIIAAEQAPQEIKLTAERIKLKNMPRIRVLPAMSGANLVQAINSRPNKPKIVIIDSLQALVGEEHDLQLEVCKRSKDFAVRLECPFIIISHVTKADVIAGKMQLQHAVDTTMTFFPDENEDIRIMNTIKNRFGKAGSSVNSYFAMGLRGLEPIELEED